MDWSEARAAICDRATESDELQLLWEELLDHADDPKKARKLIGNADETTRQMLAMLDEWEESAEDDGEGGEE